MRQVTCLEILLNDLFLRIKLRHKKYIKIFTACIWIGILAAFYLKAQGDPTTLLKEIHHFTIQTKYGPIFYIVVYALRPVIFFPAALLTLLSGALFGLWGGIFYTVIGENLSALLAYAIGKYLGTEFLNSDKMRFFEGWRKRLDQNHFMAVLTMRLIYLPFDLVNYGCGALGVRWQAYSLATFIGILPGLVTFVSFGASLSAEALINNLSDFKASHLFDSQQVIISIGIFAISLTIARFVHFKHKIPLRTNSN